MKKQGGEGVFQETFMIRLETFETNAIVSV